MDFQDKALYQKLKCELHLLDDIGNAGQIMAIPLAIQSTDDFSLDGHQIVIYYRKKVQASADLTHVGSGRYLVDGLKITLPTKPGKYAFNAAVKKVSETKEDIEFEVLKFSIQVLAHQIHLNVWDVPDAIVVGERFKFKVSVKCSSGCPLPGHRLLVQDIAGVELASGLMSPEVWPQTDSLYYAELEATAPNHVGAFECSLKSEEKKSAATVHGAMDCTFQMNVVAKPECEIEIKAVEYETQQPIEGASVVMHPYRALTDSNGVARLNVVKGSYEIVVHSSKRIPVKNIICIEKAYSSVAQLLEDPLIRPIEDWGVTFTKNQPTGDEYKA